eukprot:Pgem_evm1s3814
MDTSYDNVLMLNNNNENVIEFDSEIVIKENENGEMVMIPPTETPKTTETPSETPKASAKPVSSTTTTEGIAPTSPPPEKEETCFDNEPLSQCGGTDFIGSTCCPIGYHCKFANKYWSDCQEGVGEPGDEIVENPSSSRTADPTDNIPAIIGGICAAIGVTVIIVLIFVGRWYYKKHYKNNTYGVKEMGNDDDSSLELVKEMIRQREEEEFTSQQLQLQLEQGRVPLKDEHDYFY